MRNRVLVDKIFGKINIAKRTVSEWLVVFVFFLPFAQAFLSEFLGFPDEIKFLADVALIMLLLKIFMISRDISIAKQFVPFLIIIGVFFAYVTVTYFFKYKSIFYYIWGTRNYFRFYVAFIAYVFFLKWCDIRNWLKSLDWLYVLNFFVVIIQFVLGFRQDYLGGLFGVHKGCNGGLLVFLTVILAKVVLGFMRNEESTAKCLLFTFIGLLIAALSELKIFFIIFIAIVLMAALMTKSSVKKTVFFSFCVVMIVIFSSLLSLMYDEFAGFLSLDKLWEALINPNYATKEDIGRFTAIPIISENFLTSLPDKLLGMGLGNTDTSSLSVFNTPFYDMYGSLHYAIFLHSFLYLETGILGLLLYMSFFITSFVMALKLYKTKKADEGVCQLAMIFSVMCIMFMFYNVALRSETAAYFAFFVISLPLISSNAVRSSGETRTKKSMQNV